MHRIVDLARSGVFVVMAEGKLTNIDGRSHWYALDDVRQALARSGLTAVDKVISTTIHRATAATAQ